MDFLLDFAGVVALPFPFGSLGKTSTGAGSAGVVLFFRGLLSYGGDLLLISQDTKFPCGRQIP